MFTDGSERHASGSALSAVVIHVSPPEDGESRLAPIIGELFDTCDDVVEQLAHAAAVDSTDVHGGVGVDAEREDEVDSEACMIKVTSTALRSFTFPELFCRCRAAFPKVSQYGKGSLPRGNAPPPLAWWR